ncbi:transcriptional regulator [Paenibacillus sp. PK3_47]|nr:transcriptional regulator [Paenibacillus sp. PK3_47]
MTLLQLEILLAVAETGSFTKAGEKLLSSQSGVSHTIADLEKELGVLLFTRSRTGVTLTEAGEQILLHAREIIRQTGLISQVAASGKSLQSGTVRVGAFPSFAASRIPELFQTFRARFPGIELVLFEGNYAEVEAWIRDGAVDLGFLVHSGPDLDILQMVKDPYVIVLPPDHALGQQEIISIEQLENEPFILLSSGCEKTVLDAFQQKGLNLDARYQVAENSTVISMVEAGMGVTIVPSMILPASPAKVTVRQLTEPLSREVALAVRSREKITPAAAAFALEAVDFLN